MPGPELSFDKVRNDPGCQGQERSDGQYSGAAEKRFDGPLNVGTAANPNWRNTLVNLREGNNT